MQSKLIVNISSKLSNLLLKPTEKIGDKKLITRYMSIEAFKYVLKLDLKLYIDPTSKITLDNATRDTL